MQTWECAKRGRKEIDMNTNTINTNYITETYGMAVKKEESKSHPTETVSFRDKVAEKSESAVAQYKRKHPEDVSHVNAQVQAGKSVIAKNGADNISREDMTMEEYKRFIKGLLNSIPFDATRIYDKEIISISDAGWKQMKNDPDYEAWVLGYTVENRSVRNPFFGWMGATGDFYVEKFGASIEEHIGQSIGKFNPAGRSNPVKKKKSWWEKRQEKMEELMEEQIQKAIKKAQAKRVLEQEYYLNSRLASQQRLQSFLSGDIQDSTDAMHFQSAGRNALAAMTYENNLNLFSKGIIRSRKG